MRIFVWGTGNNAKSVLDKIRFKKEVCVIGLIEKDELCNVKHKWGRKIIGVSEISQYIYDYIIVNTIYSYEVLNFLTNKGIQNNKILFLKSYLIIICGIIFFAGVDIYE